MAIFQKLLTIGKKRKIPEPPVSPGRPGTSGGKGPVCNPGPDPCQTVQDDVIGLELPMLTISVTRRINMDIPYELSVIVPRAEMRFRERETELIYSSITVIHAPRHSPAGEQPPGGSEQFLNEENSLSFDLPSPGAEEGQKPPVNAELSHLSDLPAINWHGRSGNIKIIFKNDKI